MNRTHLNRKIPVVIIAIIVGLLHFITGPSYRGPFPNFVNGYMIDILLPFAMYLVLGVSNQSIICCGFARSAFVFAVGAVTETMQYFGIPVFGRTFDMLDYLMYASGIGLAAIFEKFVLTRIQPQEQYSAGKST